MRNVAVITSSLVVVAVLAVAWLARGPETRRPVPEVVEEQMGRTSVSPPARKPSTFPINTVPVQGQDSKTAIRDSVGTVEEEPPTGLSEDEAKCRRRLLALDQAAQARFDETVQQDRIDAERVQPAVRKLFQSMTLEPTFDLEQGREGFIDGMQIAELSRTSPLAEAGFKAGDRLTRFNGQPLEDPAQVAHLFASLGESFEVCAERENREHCRIIDLAAK